MTLAEPSRVVPMGGVEHTRSDSMLQVKLKESGRITAGDSRDTSMESDASLSFLHNFASSRSIFAALNRVSCLGSRWGICSSCFSLARASPRGTEAAP